MRKQVRLRSRCRRRRTPAASVLLVGLSAGLMLAPRGADAQTAIALSARTPTADSLPELRDDLIVRAWTPEGNPGDTLQYTIQVANPGDRAVHDFTIIWDLPPGASLLSSHRPAWIDRQTVSWPIPELRAHGVVAVRFAVAPARAGPAGGPALAAAVARGTPRGSPLPAPPVELPAALGQSASSSPEDPMRAIPAIADPTVASGAGPNDTTNLRISKAGPAHANSGDTIVYTIKARNVLAGSRATQVVVWDLLPASVEFIDASDGGTFGSGVVEWPARPQLRNDTILEYEVRVRADCPGTLINTATIGAIERDLDPIDNTSEWRTEVTGQPCTTPGPDVTVTKRGPASAGARDTILYTLDFTNVGQGPANGVQRTDALPAGVQFVSATGGARLAAGSLTWPAIDMAPGDNVRESVRVLAPLCRAAIRNTATVAAPRDANPANDVSAVTTEISGPECGSDPAIRKSGPALADSNDVVVYSLEIWNEGTADAAGLEVVDSLPALARFLDASDGILPQGGVLRWSGLALAPGDTIRKQVRVIAPACRVDLVNVALVRIPVSQVDGDLSNNRSSVSTSIRGADCDTLADSADVAIQVDAFPLLAEPGETVVFTVRAWNNGPSVAFDVEVKDSVPPANLVSATGEPSQEGHFLTWPTIASLAPGESRTFLVRFRLPTDSTARESYTNLARVKSARPRDPDLTNNVDTAVVFQRSPPRGPEPDLRVTKVVIGEIFRGQPARYRIGVHNHGDTATIGPIELTDTLPPGMTAQSASGPGWLATIEASGRVIHAEHADPLAVGDSTFLDVVVSVAGSATGHPCNVVRVVTPGDRNLSDNRAETCVSVETPPVIDLAKRADRSDMTVGSAVGYTLTLTAGGSLPMADASILDRLPAGFTYEPGSARRDGQPMADPIVGARRGLTFDLGNLSPPDTITITYVAQAGPGTPPGLASNRAQAFHRTGSSGEAIAEVLVRAGPFSDEGMIVGTVYADSVGSVQTAEDCRCLDPDLVQRSERGIPGVRVFLQDGTSAVTDAYGRYLFQGLSPRTWVVKADLSTLPAARLIPLTVRHASDGGTVLVDLKKGELHRADFAAAWSGAEAAAEIERRRQRSDSMGVAAWPGSASRSMVGDGTGMAPGVPRTRYRSLLPTAWVARFFEFDGPLINATGFPRARPDSALAFATGNAPRSGVPGQEQRGAATGGGMAGDTAEGAIALGLIEARVDFRSRTDEELRGLGRDAFEDALLTASFDDDDGRVRGGARAAFFFSGRAADRYDVTVRLETEKDERAVLFRDITPDDFYPIGGDGSVRGFDARSRGRAFARIASGDSYLMWGDFNTGSAPVGTAGTRSLGTYARTLNGALQHWEGDRYAVDAFASHDRNTQVVDRIRAEGISGPYALSRTDALVNSERVELVTRHRDQPAVILRSQILERFTDYTIEPLAGRILFRRPVPAFDDDLNPVEIRVTYEVQGDVDRFWVWGANASLKPASRIEVGGGLVRDENPIAPFELGRLDATLALPASTWVTGEWARTDLNGGLTGDAARIELLHASDRVRLRGFWIDSDSTFANPTSAYGAGRTEAGLLGVARLTDQTHVFTELALTEDGRTGIERRGGRIGLDQGLTRWLSGQVGFRYATTTGEPASNQTDGSDTRAIGIRLQAMWPAASADRPGSAFVAWEQDVSESDRRRLAVGADYRVLNGVRLYARHEFINSLTGPWHLDPGDERNATVVGVATENRSGQALFSEYRVRDAISGRESQAAIGLRNAWQVAEGVRLNASLERLTPIGSGSSGDATALTGGAEFTASPLWKGSVRAEYQARDGADNLFGSIGYSRRLTPAFGLLGSSVFSTRLDGERAWTRSRLGIAWRQVDANQWNGLARYEHRYERESAAAGGRQSSGSHILSAHVDYQPTAGAILRAQWASRFTRDRRAGIATSSSAHLAAARATVDLAPWLDVGGIGRSLFSGGFTQSRFGFGAEAGVRLPGDLRLAAGYNVFGFRDDVAAGDEYTDRGPYVQLALQFDEGLWSDRGRAGGAAKRDCECRTTAETPPGNMDLEVVIFGPTSVTSGEEVPIRIRVRNRKDPGGPADTLSVRVRISNGDFDATTEQEVRADTLILPVPIDERLNAGDTISFDIVLVAPSLGRSVLVDSIVVEADVRGRPADVNERNNHRQTTIDVLPVTEPCEPGEICPTNLAVRIYGPNVADPGEPVRYDFLTVNTTLDAEALDVWSTAVFPDLLILEQDGDQGLGRKEIRRKVATRLGPGETAGWWVTLQAPPSPTRLVIETFSETRGSWEPDLSDNRAARITDMTCGAPDCSLVLGGRIDGEIQATEGDTVIYTVTADNLGDSPLGSVMLSPGTAPAVMPADPNVTAIEDQGWYTGELAAGDSLQGTLRLVCSEPAFVVSVLVTAVGLSPVTADHQTRCLPVDLEVGIEPIPATRRRPGDAVGWRVVTRNLGPGVARNVLTHVELPSGVQVDAIRTTGEIEVSDRRVDWTVPVSLASNDSIVQTLVVQSRLDTLDLELEAEASTGTPERRIDNNRDSDGVDMFDPAPPVGDPTVGPLIPPPGFGRDSGVYGDIPAVQVRWDTLAVVGHTVHYTITTTNMATQPARAVRIVATWPARVGFVSSNRGETSGDTLLMPVTDFRPLESRVDTLVLLMPAAPDTLMMLAWATARGIPRVERATVPANRDSTMAYIQEVTITDTVFIADGVWIPVYRWLVILLPWLMLLLILLLILLIVWIIWRWPLPPFPIRPRPDPVPPIQDTPPPVPPAHSRFGPFFSPPIPLVFGLPAACGPLEVDGIRGTAYLVRPDRLVTCSHVVLNRQRGDRVSVRLGGRMIYATIHAVDPQTDVAVLRPTEPIHDIRPLELAAEEPGPSWWRGYGFAGGPGEEGVEFGGALLQPRAHDRFAHGTMTVTGPGLAEVFPDASNGLAGSPVTVDGRVVGHLCGHVVHPDSLTRSLAGLLKAVPVRRILRLLQDDGPDQRDTGARPDSLPEPLDWSIAKKPGDCREGEHHATIVFASADRGYADRLATRLEGSGFEVRLRQRQGNHIPTALAEGADRVFLLFSRNWQRVAGGSAVVADGLEPVIVRLDDTEVPAFLSRFDSVDLCGADPARPDFPFGDLLRRILGEAGSAIDGPVGHLLKATASVLEIVHAAQGRPQRTRFAVKRWRETGLPGHAPELAAARRLLESGHADLALEILEDVPAGPRASELAARALDALDRVDEAIERLEALRSAGRSDSAVDSCLATLCRRKWIASGRRQDAWIRKARELASAVYHRTRDPQAAIEAACHALAAGEGDEARLLANEVRDDAGEEAASDAGDWRVRGLANLILGDDEAAIDALEHAVAADPGATGAIAGLYRQALEIVDRRGGDAGSSAGLRVDLARVFYLPRVAIVDSAVAAPSESGLREELRTRIDDADIQLGVCSPHTLPALVFAEEVLRRGGRVQAILPMPANQLVLGPIRSAVAPRVQAVLDHDRTTTRVIDNAPSAQRTIDAQMSELIRVAVLDAALKEARQRVQRLVVLNADGGDAAARTAQVGDGDGAPEVIRLSSLVHADASRTSATRDIEGIGREVPEAEEPGVYRRRVLVAIGIDEYEQWNPLANAVNDATGIADMLEDRYGFTTRRLLNGEATASRIRELVLEKVGGELVKEDLLVLFFAGHGHTERDEDDEEHGFLVPVDAWRNGRNLEDLIPMEEVVTWPDLLPCEDVLCIFDSCFSGFAAFAGGMTKRGETEDARIAISAGSAEQPVLDGGAPGGLEHHSIFTAHLLLGLKGALEDARSGPDDVVDTMRLYVDLRDRVAKATDRQQTPVYGFMSGHGAGEIWFTAKRAAGEGPVGSGG